MDKRNKVWQEELQQALDAILSYWIKHTPDEVRGGFFGRIDEHNIPDVNAPKGVVLNARLLYTFSTAYLQNNDAACLAMADRAWLYLSTHFIDAEYGGVYWTVSADGRPGEQKKQLYAQAFMLYGLCSYFRCRKLETVKELTSRIFDVIETYGYDHTNGGYFEAFLKNWDPLVDPRLSKKDLIAEKSTNTQLHILEAYTAMYLLWPNDLLRQRLEELLNLFHDRMISDTGNLHLFFDAGWKVLPAGISYGHDIEASWLLQDAAAVIGNRALIRKNNAYAGLLAQAAVRGLDTDGGLWYETTAGGALIREKHWWPQAEAMVGFYRAWMMTGETHFADHARKSWHFIKSALIDTVYGEWHWGVDEYNQPMMNQDKTGIWKCPYHNGRACMEMIRLLKTDPI